MAVIIPINIVQSTSENSEGTEVQNTSGALATPQSNSKFVKTLKNAMVINFAKQSMQYAISNVGKWTGNSRTQTKINNGVEAITLGVQAIVNPALAIAQSALSIAKTLEEEIYRLKTENLSLSVSRARNGYTDTNSIVNSRRH